MTLNPCCNSRENGDLQRWWTQTASFLNGQNNSAGQWCQLHLIRHLTASDASKLIL